VGTRASGYIEVVCISQGVVGWDLAVLEKAEIWEAFVVSCSDGISRLQQAQTLSAKEIDQIVWKCIFCSGMRLLLFLFSS